MGKSCEVTLEKGVGERFYKNVNHMKNAKGFKRDQDIAEVIDMLPSSYSKYKKNATILPVDPYLIRLSALFECSIDELLFTDMEKVKEFEGEATDEISEEQYEKFYGIFQGFYYQTKASKGRETADDASALNACVLMIYRKTVRGKLEHKVLGIFGLDREKSEKIYRDLSEKKRAGLENAVQYILSRGKEFHFYHGKIELSGKHVYIDLRLGNREKVSMIFYNSPDEDENFIGGLGTLSSISRGRKQEPTMQYIGLTKTLLDVTEHEIAEQLLTSYPKIKNDASVNELMLVIHDCYDGSGKLLREDDKKNMIKGRINTLIDVTVTQNLARKSSVSEQDDEEFCNFILNSSKKKH